MQKPKLDQTWIRGLSSLLLAFLLSLLVTSILGCSTGTAKIDPARLIAEKAPCPSFDIELWRIDPEALELYRVLDGEKEEVLKIQGSKLMREFIVIDSQEYGKLVKALFNECRRATK